MSGIAYNPPLEDLAIFDPSVFIYDQTALTQQSALTNFLAFPTAQGTETFGDLISTGTATLNTATLSNTLSIFNGANNTTFDMNSSNNLTINNNTAGGNMFFNIQDPTLGIVSNTLSFSKSNGLNSGCNVPNNPPTTTSNFICYTASSSATTTALQLCVSPNSGSYNAMVQSNDPFMVGTGASSNAGSLVLTTWSSSKLGIRINSNSSVVGIGQNSVEVAGALIQLNTSTAGGLTSSTTQPASNDSSNKIPTTAWVQSAITGGVSSPMPYYQSYYFINAPSTFDRPASFQFNFTGSNWGVNDYFSFNFRCAMTTTDPSSTALAPNYTVISGRVDVYPNRCPANASNPSAYGLNPTLPSTSNFSLANGAIYNGTALQSSYVVSSTASPYAPFGRWYWVNSYAITSQGTSYPTSSPAPIAPYIAFGTPAQSAFGFGLWQTQFVQTNFSIFVEIINRGPNGTGQGITLTSNYFTGSGNTLNEVKVGL